MHGDAPAKPGFCPPVPSATQCGKTESRCPTLFPFWSGMANGTEPPEAAAVSPDPDRLFMAAREARNDAAPFALAAAGILVALALVSRHAHWDLLGHRLWWMWLVVAAPYGFLSATLLLGLGRLVRHDRRREIVIALLALVWVFNVLAVVVLVFSLVFHSAVHITGRQLLFSGGAAWFTDAIAFGLAFWELDCGGPVARALATAPRKPDFQFPQDENPQLARAGWAPHLWDYFYVSLTNATAFSPTDAMPLTRPAKALMAAEATLSAITVLLVAARAVNILA
jgi:hypothetical protein